MRQRINYNHLECFYILAKTLSFSKASQELKIAQPAVSKQIKSLEEYFGVQLFIRTRQNVKLSKEGLELYKRTWNTFTDFNKKIDDFFSPSDELDGPISFGCLQEIGENIFIHLLSEFKKLHPNIQINIKFLKAFEIIDEIKGGTIDLGIVPTQIDQENIRSYSLYAEKIILVSSKRNNKNNLLESVDQLPFVTFRNNDPLTEFYLKNAFPNFKMSKLKVEAQVNSHKAMATLIKNHNFFAVLPSLSIKNDLESKEIVNVGPKDLNSPLFMIHLNHSFLDRKVKELKSFIKKQIDQL